MFRQSLISLAILSLAAAGFTVSAAGPAVGQPQDPQPTQQPSQQAQQQASPEVQQAARIEQAKQIIGQVTQNWPEGPREEVDNMVNKYGIPDGLTNNMVVWSDPEGPFNEIIIYRETIDHNWPAPHQDYLQQTIFYSVPEDKFDDLAAFDGSVIAERTRGTLSARCHTEWANNIALNLAHDIIADEKSVEEARTAYEEAVKQQMEGMTPDIAAALHFQPMSQDRARNPADAALSPDRETVTR